MLYTSAFQSVLLNIYLSLILKDQTEPDLCERVS